MPSGPQMCNPLGPQCDSCKVTRRAARVNARAICRKKWGPNWHKVHSIIKKARIMWAIGSNDDDVGNVVVTDASGSFVI